MSLTFALKITQLSVISHSQLHSPKSHRMWHTNVASSHSYQPQNEAVAGHYCGDLAFWALPPQPTVCGLIWASWGFAGVSAHCLEALRWGLEEQMTVGEREREMGGERNKEKEERGQGKRRDRGGEGSTSWNEMLCYKAVRATHLFI